MALVLNDRVKETSTTTGQGTLSLAGAATGFETFVTGIGDGNTTYYLAAHESDGTWELGIGTVTDASPDTLARTTVIDTSAGNTTKIDFASGSKTIFCTLPASKAVFLDADGDVTLGANLDVGGNLVVTGTTTFNGGTLTLGDANTDNIVFGGEVDSNIIPDDDDTHDLGSASKEWKDIYIDGVAYLDSINFNGTAISSTAAELNILDGVTSTTAELNILDGVTSTTAELNIMDGNTSATSTTLADEDRVVVNDANTMKQVALTDFETYFESALDTLSNVTTVGTLNSGAISSGFGAIDIGSSNLTSTGTVSLGATSFNDNNITNVGDIAVDSISADATDINLAVTDNSATAFTIKQGSDAYFVVDTANSSESVSIGTGISGTAITLGHSTSEVTVADNLTVTGDLTVSGTTTTVNSTTVNLNDHNIVLDSGNSTSAVINGSGITIEGGSGDDATFTYNTTGPKFELKLGSSHEDLQVDQLIAASLDISGNVDVDGTLETDALSINGTSVTSTAAELNILDGVTATATELNLLDGGTSVGGSITLADGDGIVTNDGGTMKTIPASDIKTYVGAAAGAFSIANLDIDGGTDIGADLVGDDLIIVDDNAGGTNRKATLTRLMTFVNANSSSAAPKADDIQAGDGAVNLTTTSGNITIDAQANDSDIIFKGTDGSSDTTFLTIDGSDAGKALFNAGATFSSNVSISTADNTDTLKLISTDADASAGPLLVLDRASGSPADDDLIGRIVYRSRNDAGEELDLVKTSCFIADASDGTEDAQFEIDQRIAGTYRNMLTMASSAIIFNEDAQDIDFRVESSGNANAFKVDAGNDKIVVDVSFDLNDNKRIRLGDGNDLQIYHSGSSSYITNATGDLTLDLAADLVIDADGGDVIFQDGGTTIGTIDMANSDFKIQSNVSDKDILISGNDGGTTQTVAQFDMSDNGALICKNNVTAFGSPSDIRLKENIEVIPNALDKVSQLQGITFNYKKDGKKSTGLIAQELEKVLPEVVYDTHEIGNDDEEFKAVRYGNTVGLLVEAIKELKTKVEELKNKIC